MITTHLVSDSMPRPSTTQPPVDVPTLGLADLAFESCLERTDFGETWKVKAPDAKDYICQFVPPNDPETTAKLLARIGAYRHAGLIAWQALTEDANRPALLAALAGPTLADRLRELWTAGRPGIPRDELLAYLRCAALVLDTMHARHQTQHLWLEPRQFVVHDGRAELLGFGLVPTWWAHRERPTGALSPRYAAPELQKRICSPRCDQYSLALIYAEMLTGTHPWRGRGTAWAVQNPDLGLLPAQDRIVLRRALSPDYRARFETNLELIDALEKAAKQVIAPAPPLPLVTAPGPLSRHARTLACQTLEQFVHELVDLAAGNAPAPTELAIRFTLEPSRHLKTPKFLSGIANQLPQFDDFCRQWHAKTIRRGERLVILAINAAPSVWQWLSGRRIGLEIRLEFLPVAWGNQRSQVAVAVKPFGCDSERALQLLMELGPKLLESVRTHLAGQAEQRGVGRFAFRERLRVCPVVNGVSAEPVDCITKDISAGGIGFYLPVELPASQVYISLPDVDKVAPYSALAQIVRKQPAHEGWYEIGAAFPVRASAIP